MDFLSIFFSIFVVSMVSFEAHGGEATVAWDLDYDGKSPQEVIAGRSFVAVFSNGGAGAATIDHLNPETGALMEQIVMPEGPEWRTTSPIGVLDDGNGNIISYFVAGIGQFYLVDALNKNIKWNFTLPDDFAGFAGKPTFSDDGSRVFVNTRGYIWAFDTVTGDFRFSNIQYSRRSGTTSYGPFDADITPLLYFEGFLYAALAEEPKQAFCTRPTMYKFRADDAALIEEWEMSDTECGSTLISSCCGWGSRDAAPVLVQPSQDTIAVSFSGSVENDNNLGVVGFGTVAVSIGPKVYIYENGNSVTKPFASADDTVFIYHNEAKAIKIDDNGFLSTPLWNNDISSKILNSIESGTVDGVSYAFYCLIGEMYALEASSGFVATKALNFGGSNKECSINADNKLMVELDRELERVTAFTMVLSSAPPPTPSPITMAPATSPTIAPAASPTTMAPATSPPTSSAAPFLVVAAKTMCLSLTAAVTIAIF